MCSLNINCYSSVEVPYTLPCLLNTGIDFCMEHRGLQEIWISFLLKILGFALLVPFSACYFNTVIWLLYFTHYSCYENLSSALAYLIIISHRKKSRYKGTSGEINPHTEGGLIRSGYLIIFSASTKEWKGVLLGIDLTVPCICCHTCYCFLTIMLFLRSSFLDKVKSRWHAMNK